MKTIGQYIVFVIVVLLLQIFLLNNLTFTTLVAPTLYIICIVLLPLDTSPVKILFAGLALGLLMDITMGTCGLNTLTTLPIAFFRRSILQLTTGFSDFDNESDIPCIKRLGRFRFHRYILSIVTLHSLLFIAFEHLSFSNFGFFLARLACSTAATLCLAYLMLVIFIPKLTAKK